MMTMTPVTIMIIMVIIIMMTKISWQHERMKKSIMKEHKMKNIYTLNLQNTLFKISSA